MMENLDNPLAKLYRESEERTAALKQIQAEVLTVKNSSVAKIARLTKANAELREALKNSDGLLQALGTIDDPIVGVARRENRKALANSSEGE